MNTETTFPRHRIMAPNGEYIEVSIETFSPEHCDYLLENTHKSQRSLNKRQVALYSSQMRRGLWSPLTGESIKLTSKGELIDGQHRVAACSMAAVPVTFMIMRGINDINSLDLGKKRNLSDILKINDVRPIPGLSENVIAAFVDGLWNAVLFVGRAHGPTASGSLELKRPNKSANELFEFFSKNPKIAVDLHSMRNFKLASMGSKVPLTGNLLAYYIVRQLDPEIAKTILDTLRTGAPQTANGYSCPAFILLKHILKIKQERIYFRKEEYISLWIWAYEQMIHGGSRKKVTATISHRPGQGHHGSKMLIEKLKEFKI